MRQIFSSLHLFFFDILLPPRKTEEVVRTLSKEKLERLVETRGCLPYRDVQVKALIWEIKYRKNDRALAIVGEYLASLLCELSSEEIGRPLLIPIPMHESRRKKRGYNQTDLICEAALRHLEKDSLPLEYSPQMLMRTRATPPQQGLIRSKRIKNVEHSMRAEYGVKDRVCIVVDDVSTTGATFTEAKRALSASGARKTICIALAESVSEEKLPI